MADLKQGLWDELAGEVLGETLAVAVDELGERAEAHGRVAELPAAVALHQHHLVHGLAVKAVAQHVIVGHGRVLDDKAAVLKAVESQAHTVGVDAGHIDALGQAHPRAGAPRRVCRGRLRQARSPGRHGRRDRRRCCSAASLGSRTGGVGKGRKEREGRR